MTNKTIRAVGTAFVVALWLALVGFAWFGPTKERSEAEKRPLAQMPEISFDAIFGTDETGAHPFMAGFEDFALDQFPLRDTWRSAKAVFHNYVLQNKDNNGYYYRDGYLAKQDLTLNADAVTQKTDVLNSIYSDFLKNSGGKFYVSMVPDKSYYLAQQYGYPSMDYAQLETMLRQNLPWAQYVDITGTLELGDYYHTDTHWRQEALIPTAQALAQAMGGQGPQGAYTPVKVDKPFYGVYHAQAALPMVPPDEMYVMESPVLDSVIFSYEGMRRPEIYDMTKLDSDDQYNIFLSSAKAGPVILRNPNARTDKRLVVFRDSFGSSIAPLLVEDYREVVLIDLRVTQYWGLPGFVNFKNADVLVLMSALALNNADEAFMI